MQYFASFEPFEIFDEFSQGIFNYQNSLVSQTNLKIKETIGNIIAWWFMGGFIGGSLGAIVLWVVGIDSSIIASFVMVTVVLPIFVP